MSKTEPEAPAFGSDAPKTTRGIRANTIAPAHIAHGSSVTYSTASAGSRQPPPARAAASRMARTSAWAVGSPRSSRSFGAAATTSPPETTTHPIGTSSCSAARSASLNASRMKYSSRGKKWAWFSGTPCLGACSCRHTLRRPPYPMKISPPVLAAAAALVLAAAPSASAADYVPGEVLVAHDASASSTGTSTPQVVRTRRGESVRAAVKRLRQRAGIRYAVPNYIAHASGFVPNDPGLGSEQTQWQSLQWNFAGPFGVDAPDAWQQAIAAGAPGGRGVVVAVLDTGVAYENYRRFRRAPDLYASRFTKPYDFVGGDRHPNDEN